jgi:hypothetical protein
MMIIIIVTLITFYIIRCKKNLNNNEIKIEVFVFVVVVVLYNHIVSFNTVLLLLFLL